MSLGERLKIERERLGLTQPEFAQLVGASRKSQIRWEKDESYPTADALAIWSDIGLDVLFVITGQRNVVIETKATETKMSQDERELIEAFDGMTPKQQKALLEVGKVMAQPELNKNAG